MDSKHQTMQGVAFPISQEAMDKLNQLKHGSPNYVQLVRTANLINTLQITAITFQTFSVVKITVLYCTNVIKGSVDYHNIHHYVAMTDDFYLKK